MKFSNFSDHLLKNVFLFYFWEPFGREYSQRQEKFKGVIKLILTCLYKSLVNINSIRKHSIPEIKDKIAFGTVRQQNKDNLTRLKSLLNRKYTEVPDRRITKNRDFEDLFYGYLGLRYTFHHMYWYFALKGKEKIAYRNKFWLCFFGLGMYRYVYLQLKKSPTVECFVGTNDHIGSHQMGFVAAKKLGIRSIYIQHASVTENFPPLHVDLALLDGEDAKNKYKIAPNFNTQIRLIGAPKYDIGLEKLKNHSKISNNVGICVNMNEKEHGKLLELCKALREAEIPFIIRFHPHLNDAFKESFIDFAYKYSDVSTESETDFILQCHTIISGDSNILLDALVLYRRPIYFSDSTQHHDYYGFLKNGILDKKYTEINEVIETLDENSFDVEKYRKRAKHFIDTINTPFEGKSSLLALKEIFDFIQEPLPKNIQQQIVYK